MIASRDIKKFSQSLYDLVIIGGGINGTALANLASLNGLKVALFEKADFASGTSSKSTKLLHGGLRYLAQGDIALVRESLHERVAQMHAAPHLTNVQSFVIPVYDSKMALWLTRFGVSVYDLLAGSANLGPSRLLAKREVEYFFPDLNKTDLKGGVLFYDVQMDDARMCLEHALQARQQGADILTYAEMKSTVKVNGKAVGVNIYDHVRQTQFEVRGKKIIYMVGAWTDQLLQRSARQVSPIMRNSKGVHFVYPGRLSEHGLFLTLKDERRVIFMLPWHDQTLIGTTDTEHKDNPDRVDVEESDITYLVEKIKAYLPDVEIDPEKIITQFAGLRPLPNREGKTSDISRQHVIKQHYTGVYYLLGGKYTTHRKIADDCLTQVIQQSHLQVPDRLMVYGGINHQQEGDALPSMDDFDPATQQWLKSHYGFRVKDVLEVIDQYPAANRPLCSCSPALEAEVIYACQSEMAIRADDVVQRRLGLQFYPCQNQQCRKKIAILVDEYNASTPSIE